MGKIARQPQLLTISPETELEFRGDPKEVSISSVQLRNDTNHKIGFKVMTNAPHLLFVSPTSDVIGPGSQSTIKVKLQPSSDGSDATSMKFLKLLIQSIVLKPEDAVEGIDKFISLKNSSTELMETKLSCTFKEVYTSEIDFPLTPEGHDAHASFSSPSSSSSDRKSEKTAAGDSSLFSSALARGMMVLLAAILLWYIYSSFFADSPLEAGDTGDSSPDVIGEAAAAAADDDD